jgi:uncharacterized protein (DUF697 family)
MSVSLKAANVWRVLRDVDLEAIRASAEARFVLPVVADDPEDADGLRTLLSEGVDPAGHPWLVVLRATDGLPSLPARPLFGILVSRSAALSRSLLAVRESFAHNQIGVITVIAGDPAATALPDPAERARITAPAIDSRLARDLSRVLAAQAGPDWQLALARQLPLLREPVIASLIEDTAQANAGYALASGLAEVVPVLSLPVSFGDMVVLTKNQLVMSYRIALACGLGSDPRRLIPEILGVLGGGLLFRQAARQLIGLIPVLGIAPKVAIAYGGTYAIGRAIAGWALDGREVSAELVQRLSRESLERSRAVARSLVENARSRPPKSSRWDSFRRQVPFARHPRA